jgi:MYXO-CTERM domain-containing protein
MRMKTSRISAAVVATLALVAAGEARADGTAVGSTVVLNTYSKAIVIGDALGPQQNGAPRIGKDTGAGVMDSAFTWDQVGYKTNPAEVLIGSVYTRSSLTPNNNNSYMQGGFILTKLTQSGVQPGAPVDLPQLNGERAFMRPQIAFTSKYVVLIAASEDNGVNNNPQPVMFLADKTTGKLVQIPNSTRGNNINKPTNLIQQALRDGVAVNNPNNQRGPHSIVQVTDNSFIVGMQYNNQAQEAFRVTIADNGAVKMNWLQRYSNTAQHCRPQVAMAPGASEAFITAVEANNQPAEIGFRLTKFNVDTGKTIASTIAVRSQPGKNAYVAEPAIGVLGTGADTKLAITYTMGSQARQRNGDNGHAGGSPVAMLSLFNGSDLKMIGQPLVNAAQFSRHVHMYTTAYGPNAEPAIAVISGSSTGTGKGFSQLIPLKADGTLGLKDPAKVYTVAPFADVANVQARGKRNPNNQAKGFINGLGNVPNPGYDKGNTAFMPEVKMFSVSAVTGATTADTAQIAKRNSLWLSLVPAAWKEGLQTTPGQPTDKPGVDPVTGQPSETGPAPRTNGPATNPSGDATSSDETNVLEGTEGTNPDGAGGSRAALGSDNGGCSVSSTSTSSSGFGVVGLAIAGVLAALRRRKEGK